MTTKTSLKDGLTAEILSEKVDLEITLEEKFEGQPSKKETRKKKIGFYKVTVYGTGGGTLTLRYYKDANGNWTEVLLFSNPPDHAKLEREVRDKIDELKI